MDRNDGDRSTSKMYQIVRRSVSTKNDNSFITHRNSYNIISHLHIRVSRIVNLKSVRARRRSSGARRAGRKVWEMEVRREELDSSRFLIESRKSSCR